MRSKSELFIAEKLNALKINYHYERPLEGTVEPGTSASGLFLYRRCWRRDFLGASWADGPGELPRRLGVEEDWYAQNGYAEGRNLFTSNEEQIRDIDFIDKLAKTIQKSLE